MIAVTVEAHSIAGIEQQAAQAFASGESPSANPYRFGSAARRVWMLHYDKCQRLADRSTAPATDSQEGGAA